MKISKEAKEKLKLEIKSEIFEQLDKRKIKLDQAEFDSVLDRVQKAIIQPKLDSQEIVVKLLSDIKSTDEEKRLDFYRDEVFSPKIKNEIQASILDQIRVPKDGEPGIQGEKGEPGKDAQSLPLTDVIKKK